MFKIAYRRTGDVTPFVYLDGAEGLVLGEAATLASGALAKTAAAAKPTHIVMGVQREDGMYPALEVSDTIVFETVAGAAIADSVVGSKVQLSADALTVTATTGGAFQVLSTDGADESTVQGVFVG